METPLKLLSKNTTKLFDFRKFSNRVFSLVSILIVSVTIFHSCKISYLEMNQEIIHSLKTKVHDYEKENQKLSYQIVKLQAVLDELTNGELCDLYSRGFFRIKPRSMREICSDHIKNEREKLVDQLESTRKFFKSFKYFDFANSTTYDEKSLDTIRELRRSIEDLDLENRGE